MVEVTAMGTDGHFTSISCTKKAKIFQNPGTGLLLL